ncbi:MAG: 2Fe-2S iron-sulfur cluster-binding protein [Lyngbya sp.]|nr:2Fe-2S iron-sulfur cluster-binding protein [Lyngbya sp.]
MNAVKFVNEAQEIQVASHANLREQALKNGIEIYKGVGKVFNCRGNGKCGNCLVEIVEGTDNLSPETAAEFQKLKKKPAHSRLACQAFIKGDISVKTKP